MEKERKDAINNHAKMIIKNKTVTSGLRVPKELLERFRKEVKKKGLDVSKMLRLLMEDYLKKE